MSWIIKKSFHFPQPGGSEVFLACNQFLYYLSCHVVVKIHTSDPLVLQTCSFIFSQKLKINISRVVGIYYLLVKSLGQLGEAFCCFCFVLLLSLPLLRGATLLQFWLPSCLTWTQGHAFCSYMAIKSKHLIMNIYIWVCCCTLPSSQTHGVLLLIPS